MKKSALFLVILISISAAAFSQKRQHNPHPQVTVVPAIQAEEPIPQPVYASNYVIAIKILGSGITAPVTDCSWARKGDTIMVISSRYVKGHLKKENVDTSGAYLQFATDPYWSPISGYECNYETSEIVNANGDTKVSYIRKAVVL